jgi:hypothetical protein
MIIEDLIRIGRLLIRGGLGPDQLLRLTSDVTSNQVRNFFQHVFVVELPDNSSDNAPVALPMQVWGQEVQPDPKKKKTVFEPDINKAVGAPFVFPGGNPIHPQGVYGVPVFPVFEKHLASFRSGPEAVQSFLEGRLKRCPSFNPSDDELDSIARELHRQILADDPTSAGKTLCLIVLADASSPDSPYQYCDERSDNAIGRSALEEGKYIVPKFDRIQELYGRSKVAEGRELGARDGECSVCGDAAESNLVSIYCKSWPWFLPTWTCPVSNCGDKKSIVEGIALDEKCYEALNVGSSYFAKIAAPVDSIVTRELFSPVADREGQRTVQHRSIADLTAIYGAILLLPIMELEQLDGEERQEFGERLRLPLNPGQATGRLQRHVERVVGFEAAVPSDVDDSIYRLTLVYYSGDPTRGDVHLRAIIEDVIPSVLYDLVKLAQQVAKDVPRLCEEVLPGSSEKQQAYHAMRFQYIPFVLARAYGGPYVWEQLQRVLRRQRLDLRRPTANVAHRIAGLVSKLPKSEYEIREEALFYLALLAFVDRYNNTIARGETGPMSMRNWRVLLEMVTVSPPEDMEFRDATELGFACGVLVRQFSRRYRSVTKVGAEGKDYLKHRVLTFGSDLSPEVVWKKALPGIFNVELKLDKVRLSEAFKRRVGIVLNECEDQQEKIRANRDSFMVAFWSGYSLQKTDKASDANEHFDSQPQEGAVA